MGNFSDEDIVLAKEVNEKYGVPISITLAQYALESGYGKSTVGKNNYFNIKGNGYGGYRDYNSKEESFLDYGRLLSTERYTSKTSGATTAKDYITGVKNAGYAEDENYISKVMSIIDKNNLTSYDGDNFTSGSSGGFSINGNSIEVKWWGDIVIVVFAILLLILAVVFLCLAFTDTTVAKDLNKIKKIAKGGKHGNS